MNPQPMQLPVTYTCGNETVLSLRCQSRGVGSRDTLMDCGGEPVMHVGLTWLIICQYL